MLDHESQWLLRSAFTTGRFDLLIALAMTVMEITEFHLYHISDVSHFSALSFCLVFIALTLLLYSLPSEYQISSLNYSFMKGFLTLSRWQSLQQGGIKKPKPNNKTQKNLTQKQLPSKTPRQQHQTTRKHGGWGTEIILARSWIYRLCHARTCCCWPKPGPRYTLSINPQQQYAASLLIFMLKSISRKVSDFFRHPPPENTLLLEVQKTLMLFL